MKIDTNTWRRVDRENVVESLQINGRRAEYLESRDYSELGKTNNFKFEAGVVRIVTNPTAKTDDWKYHSINVKRDSEGIMRAYDVSYRIHGVKITDLVDKKNFQHIWKIK